MNWNNNIDIETLLEGLLTNVDVKEKPVAEAVEAFIGKKIQEDLAVALS